MIARRDVLLSAGFFMLLFPSTFSLVHMHENGWNADVGEGHEEELDWSHSGNDTIDQILDHFCANQTTTFPQRYFYNRTFANDSGVVFLELCGEGTCRKENLKHFNAFAEHFGAAMYALEHRYYGESFPNGDNQSARTFLSSRQALEDAAYFIQQMNAQSKIGLRWIVFGCSYPGMLSLWFRQMYPELAIGAIGSSAPIRAVLDFYGYLQATEEYIRNFDEYNGTRSCYDAVHEGYAAIKEAEVNERKRKKFDNIMHESIVRQNVAKDNVHPAMTNVTAFLMEMRMYFTFGAQFGISDATRTACELLDLLSNDIQAEPTASISNSTIDALVKLNLTKESDEKSPNYISWMYQTCAEFGFYQTTNFGSGIFGSSVPLEEDLQMCKDSYNITVDQIERSVDEVNEFYGGTEDYKGTNAVITYGTADPWSRLVKKTANHPSVTIVEMPGAHHCSDRHMEVTAPPNVLIIKNIEQWLREKPDNNKQVDSPKDDRPHERPLKGMFRAVVVQLEQEHECSFLPSPCSGRVMQPIDHFDEYNKDAFRQRFFINSEFGKENGPNILFISGEYEATEEMAWDRKEWFHVAMGENLGANIFVLEHRYFGYSFPSTPDLEYLTTAQALFDIATFINSINEETGTTGEWIVFGEAYSGALAAWSRQWFPHLINGAYSISPALEAKLNFYEHIQFADNLLRNENCYSRIKDAFSEMLRLFPEERGRRKISDLLRLEPRWCDAIPTTEDLQFVFRTILAELGIAPGLQSISAALVETCEAMEKNETNTSALTALSNLLHTKNVITVQSSLKQHYSTAKQALRYRGTVDDKTMNSLLWQYLQCNELGFFQTTDYNDGLFGNALPVNLHLLMCENIFGLGVDHVTAAVERTNRRYGGRRHFNVSNVAIFNGDYDPWNGLGILSDYDSCNNDIIAFEPTSIGGLFNYTERMWKDLGLKEMRESISGWLGYN